MTDSAYIIEITEQNFVDAVAKNSHRVPVLLDFYADWCAPCQSLKPVLTKLAKEYQGKFILAKINSDQQQALTTQFNVQSLPTVKIVRNEKTINEFQGIKSESELREIIDTVIDPEWAILYQQAIENIHQGELKTAISLLTKAYQLQPDELQIKVDLASILFQTDDLTTANAIINTFTDADKLDNRVKTLLTRISYQQILTNAPSQEQLQKSIKANPSDFLAREQLIAQHVVNGLYEPALILLLELLVLEKNGSSNKARQGLLDLFNLLGNTGELVKRYRSKMFSILN